MSLLSQPGVTKDDLVSVIPLKWQAPVDPDTDRGSYQPVGSPITVVSVKIGSADSFREGKQDQTVSYTLYAEVKRGQTLPLGEKDQLWHPEASERLEDGTPNYETAMTINSVVSRRAIGSGKIALIEAGRTY